MGHTPNAEKGVEAFTSMNEDILEEIATYSDIAMAKQNADRDASIAAIKKRHANELKAAKRNHKHRAKKIKARMKEFEDMDPMELADRFRDGVEEDIFTRPFGGNLRHFQGQLINSLDFAQIENRMMRTLMSKQIIHREMLMGDRQSGKSEAFRLAYGGTGTEVVVKPRYYEWLAARS